MLSLFFILANIQLGMILPLKLQIQVSYAPKNDCNLLHQRMKSYGGGKQPLASKVHPLTNVGKYQHNFNFCYSSFLVLQCNDLFIIYPGWHKVREPANRVHRQRRISSIAKTPNIRCFVVKLHLSRFTRFFRGNIPIL